MILNLDLKILFMEKKFYKRKLPVYKDINRFFITTKLLKISLSLTFLTKFHLKKVLLQDMFLKLINLKILKGTLK